ncbi:endolytic transglycosylase MltG [Patescibacteria group bacterium]|nr:endolytic transglycosylase MltG [Patescibacteria group bacterium]MBU1448639.1 endolytic transglycosylase MltG [Patescibacteria group bacterium]MBU2613503.1 endolytic transglycosylase MltG [Patescibacteria group bacterium]
MRFIFFAFGSTLMAATLATMFFIPSAFLRMPLPDTSTVQVEIPLDADAEQVATLLKDAGIIRNADAYRLYALLDSAARRPKPGTYDLKPGMNYRRLARMLSLGPAREEVTIRVFEGWRIRDIQKALERLGIEVAPSDFYVERFFEEYPFLAVLPPTSTLEGYLFPDTYRVFKDQLPDALFRKQLDEFQLKTSGFEEAAATSLRTLHEVVILASIVERESGSDRDDPIIAGIFMNRMKRGMKLQSDATLNYVTSVEGGRMTYTDLANPSPYNSYKYDGLPPGPISNPGKAALDAALHPAETDYFFFLADRAGRTYFARTGAEHAINRARAFGE